jgi:DNA-binding response OmpR family regulator
MSGKTKERITGYQLRAVTQKREKFSLLIHNLGDAMYNILAIDDEKAILDIIKIVLSRAGFKVEIALDGQEGIQKFDSDRFDLVITDIKMPRLDGRDVVDHIRNSDRPCTPIIGISGTPWYFENIQFDAIFTKPFPFEDLINSILHLSMQVGYDCELI